MTAASGERARHRHLSLLAVGTLALGAGCAEPCRAVPVRPLAIPCTSANSFSGELHFDSAATFDAFLRDVCELTDDEEMVGLLQQVDFAREAVFVSRGPLALGASRCLASREVGEVWVCDGGLKVAFLDVESNEPTCADDRWTVAVVLSRSDLRAALESAP